MKVIHILMIDQIEQLQYSRKFTDWESIEQLNGAYSDVKTRTLFVGIEPKDIQQKAQLTPKEELDQSREIIVNFMTKNTALQNRRSNEVYEWLGFKHKDYFSSSPVK
jgi:hypothetical protein